MCDWKEEGGLARAVLGEAGKERLADASDLVFDYEVPMEEREAWIREKVKDPCCFRVGDVGVMLEFSADGPSLQECLAALLRRKKGGL